MRPGRQELLRSGVLDLWNSRVQELMILGHQGFLTSRDQDAKTSIRVDFLISLFHDGLSSRFIHSGLMQFCSRYQFRERVVRLFRLAGEQVGTGRDIRPVFGGQKHDMFCPRQAVFSVTRNRFRNRKQLARKGGGAPPKSSLFTGHPVCRHRFSDDLPYSLDICFSKARFSDLLHTKTGADLARSAPVTP